MYTGTLSKETKKLMEKYNDTFGEIFPLMEVDFAGEQELNKAILDCIESNKLFNSDFENSQDVLT